MFKNQGLRRNWKKSLRGMINEVGIKSQWNVPYAN